MAGVTAPSGAPAPTGAPAPATCHVLDPGHQQLHKHILDE
jgi:hypothetical protein